MVMLKATHRDNFGGNFEIPTSVGNYDGDLKALP